MTAKKELIGQRVSLHLNGSIVHNIKITESYNLAQFEKELGYWKTTNPEWFARQARYIFGEGIEVQSAKSKDK